MDLESVKTDLLAIIKEAENLGEEELITVPGSNIQVKRGREREFNHLCYDYYQLYFNQKVENDTDTITPVYDLLVKEVREEKEEYLKEQAYQFTTEVQAEFNHFKALKKSFETVERSYELTVRSLKDLYLKRSSSADWQQSVDDRNAEVKRLAENSASLKEQMLAAKKKVNDCLLKYLDTQMKDLVDSFTKTTAGTKKALAADKETYVLASDEAEYNSLYLLSQILKVANSKENMEDLIMFEDSMIISRDQQEIVKSLLPNISLFDYIKNPKNVPKQEVNQKLMDKITAALRMMESKSAHDVHAKPVVIDGEELEAKISEAYYDNYVNLIKALRYLNKANNSKQSLVSVWDGAAYVLYLDAPSFEELIKNISFMDTLNPDTEKIEHNEKLINELCLYLDKIAGKVSKKQGVANLPIKSTKVVGDRAWVVLEDDLEEANRIVEIISLLEKQKKHLTGVWNNMAYVDTKSIPEFKRLANATRYLGVKVPNTPANRREIKKLEETLADLIRKANNTENAKLASNGLVLESDFETYKLLEEKYKYLEDAKTSEDLEYVDGVQIASKYAPRYHEIHEILNKNLNPDLNPPKKTANEEELEKINARIEELSKKSDLTDIEKEELDILQKKVPYLEKGIEALKNGLEVEEVDGIQVVKGKASEYHELNEKLNNALNKYKVAEKNNKEIAKIEARLDELSKKANLSAEEKEEEKLLKEQLDILKTSIDRTDLEPVDEVMIAKDLVPKYQELKEALHKILNPPAPTPFEENDKEIEKAKARMAELEEKAQNSKRGKKSANGKTLKADEKEYKALEDKIKLLEEAKTSSKVTDVNGIKVPSDKEEEYNKASKVAQKKNRKKVISIRKLKDLKTGISIKQNWKTVVGYGLCLTVAVGVSAVVLPQIIPTVVYSLACNSMAASSLPLVGPIISSGLNGLASGLAFLGSGTVGAMTNGAAAGQALSSLGLSLLKAGGLGAAGISLKKMYDLYMSRDEHGLRDPNRKTAAQKIIKIGEELKANLSRIRLKANMPIKDQIQNMAEVPTLATSSITQTDLVNAQSDYEANQENLTGEGLTEEEILQQQLGINATHHIIDGTMQSNLIVQSEDIDTLEPPAILEPAPNSVATPTVNSTDSHVPKYPHGVLTQPQIDELIQDYNAQHGDPSRVLTVEVPEADDLIAELNQGIGVDKKDLEARQASVDLSSSEILDSASEIRVELDKIKQQYLEAVAGAKNEEFIELMGKKSLGSIAEIEAKVEELHAKGTLTFSEYLELATEIEESKATVLNGGGRSL